MSIKFYCFPKELNAPSTSGYCQKLETFLHATGFSNYTLQTILPTSAPKGKLPFIELEHDGKCEKIADSHMIVKHLILTKVTDDPDASLTAAQRADSRAWQAWTEELIYPALSYTRWGRPTNFAIISRNLPVPGLVRPILARYLRWKILRSLWGHGVGRHSDEEIDQLLREYVDGLEARLERDDYFHGKEPTLVDVVVYAFLANAIGSEANPEYRTMVLSSERLKRYTADLTKRWFPNYETLLSVVTKPPSRLS
jgi:glutathione S-transferase